MKIFILLLALGLCLADSVPGGYQQIDTAEAQADPTIQSYIQAGLDAVVQNAIKNGYFSNSDFTLTQINSVYEQVVNGVNYKFDCNFTDSQGVNIRANFTVSHSASENTTDVSSFVYKVYYPPTTTVTTTVTSDAPSNATVVTETEEEAVVEGESGEVVAAEEATAIVEADQETAVLVPVEEEEGMIAVDDEEEVVYNTPITVIIPEPESEGEGEIAPAEEGFALETTVIDVPAEATEEAESVVVSPSEEAQIENAEAPQETEEAAPVVSADGFTSISAAEFAQDQDLQNNFQYGFQTVVQSGINAKKIPNTIFNTANALSASKKAVKNGVLYKFTAEASNGDNVDLELTFNVLHQVPSYSYKVKITTTTPSNNNTNTTTPPVIVTPPTNTTTPNTTVPSNNTNTNTTSGNWVNVDLAQVQRNAEINSSLVNGFNQVIQTVVQKKALKDDNYTITQVVAASRNNLTNGVNYKFTVKAQNTAGTTFLNMNYTTYYRYSNKSVKTVAYQYTTSTKGTPVPTPAQNNTSNNTNTTVPTNNTSGYVALSNAQIQAQDVQSALKYGSGQIVNLGKQQGKIPAGTYNVAQVASVFKKVQPSGTNYNCTVTLKSAANVTVNANFNVFSNATSNAMNLQAYSYGVTGIKKI